MINKQKGSTVLSFVIIIVLLLVVLIGIYFLIKRKQQIPAPIVDTPIADIKVESPIAPTVTEKPTNPIETLAVGSSTIQGAQAVTNANNKFVFNSFIQLNKTEKGNIFYSPFSIFSALAMTYEGAKGQTASEIKSVFNFPDTNILRPNFASNYKSINTVNANYELKTGNALWVQNSFPLLANYLDSVNKYYGGKATNLDFINSTETSRQTINSYIEKQTNNKITNLIPSGGINSMTRLVLTNAVYFKGTWKWSFDKTLTTKQDFNISSLKKVNVDMMTMLPKKTDLNYFGSKDLQILELPYKGDKLSMYVLLPTNDIDSMKSLLTIPKIASYILQMKSTKLEKISLPKFEFTANYLLKDTLSVMGMPTAFSSSLADFSGMTGKKDLFIGSVFHKAYIKVDEEGTEAAAATAVVMTLTAAMPSNNNISFIADHPFIFIIQDKVTGNILFTGKVVDPTAN